MSHRDLILHSALTRFALEGFGATSVQHIADDAGVSKATVLYHFTSKEELLDHALTPVLDAFEKLINLIPADQELGNPAIRQAFVDAFVPFLIAHRLGIHIIVTHAHIAQSHTSLSRAMELMSRIAGIVEQSSSSPLDALRFGVALSGATYSLVSETLLGMNRLDPTELEHGLKTVLSEMLQPAQTTAGGN